MVTVVNNPPQSGDSGNGWLVGVIVLIIFVLVVLFWGGPLLRRVGMGSGNENPPKIDVNVDGSQNTTNEGDSGSMQNPPDINIITPTQATPEATNSEPTPEPSG